MKKKTNTKNISKTTKTNKRGRPTKSFVSKKPKIKRDGPGRPKKHEQPILTQIPEKKENKIKDVIIFVLFIISFLIFGFSIYINQKNKPIKITSQQETILEAQNTGLENPSNQTGNIIEDEKFTILIKIYGYLQNGEIDNIYQHIDSTLKQSTTFKTYFSKNRLQRFIDNIDNKTLKIEKLSIDNTASKVTYKVTYSIKNVVFVEERETNFITRDNEQKIAKIMCTTKGCSKMPFFNPGKYF